MSIIPVTCKRVPRETGIVFRQIKMLDGLFHIRAVREPWASHRAFVLNPRRQHPSRQSGHIHPRNVSEPAKLSTVDVELNRVKVHALVKNLVRDVVTPGVFPSGYAHSTDALVV